MRSLLPLLAFLLFFSSCEESPSTSVSDAISSVTDSTSNSVAIKEPERDPCELPPPNSSTRENYYPTIPTTEKEVQPEDAGRHVFNLIVEKEWDELAAMIPTGKGILIANSVDINPSSTPNLQGNHLSYYFECSKEKDWNVKPPSGEPPLITFAEYCEQYVFPPLSKHYDVYVNEWLTWGNARNTMKEAFPGCSIVQALHEGQKESDWKALNLIFQKINQDYFLVALVSDYWTP